MEMGWVAPSYTFLVFGLDIPPPLIYLPLNATGCEENMERQRDVSTPL